MRWTTRGIVLLLAGWTLASSQASNAGDDGPIAALPIGECRVAREILGFYLDNETDTTCEYVCQVVDYYGPCGPRQPPYYTPVPLDDGSYDVRDSVSKGLDYCYELTLEDLAAQRLCCGTARICTFAF
jgi:hypothetical protein